MRLSGFVRLDAHATVGCCGFIAAIVSPSTARHHDVAEDDTRSEEVKIMCEGEK